MLQQNSDASAVRRSSIRRTILVGLVAASLCLPVQAALPPVNPAAYQILSNSGAYCMDISGSQVVQLTCSITPKASQVWNASNPLGTGILQSGSLCLTVSAGVATATSCGSPAPASQLWTLLLTSTGRVYQLQNQQTGKCLSSPGSTSGGQLNYGTCSSPPTLSQLFETNHPPK